MPQKVSQDVSVEEMFLFLALILKMGHDQHDTLKEYWSRDPMWHAPFCFHVMKHNRLFISSSSYILKTMKMLPTGIEMIMTGCGNEKGF
jgi:hypothetical protein